MKDRYIVELDRKGIKSYVEFDFMPCQVSQERQKEIVEGIINAVRRKYVDMVEQFGEVEAYVLYTLMYTPYKARQL